MLSLGGPQRVEAELLGGVGNSSNIFQIRLMQVGIEKHTESFQTQRTQDCKIEGQAATERKALYVSCLLIFESFESRNFFAPIVRNRNGPFVPVIERDHDNLALCQLFFGDGIHDVLPDGHGFASKFGGPHTDLDLVAKVDWCE